MNREQIWDTLDNKILPLVQKPGRYIGGEVNSVYKDLSKVNVRIGLAFPDVYEIGMSNLGLKILYEEINSKDGLYAERIFSPWIDMEKYMRKYSIPAFSLETHSALMDFDVIGFSLQSELGFTNVLNMLNLAGIPLRAEQRAGDKYPLIIAGGILAYTPEPMSPFVDLFVIGDGEELIVNILEFYNKHARKLSRKEFLERIAKEMEHVYVPSLYNVSADKQGRLTDVEPSVSGIPAKVKKHVIQNLDKKYIPVNPVIPLIEIVHDRISIEIMRGCPRMCRFCQAGILYKPVRSRSIQDILDRARVCIKNTGYGEIGLLSLSSMDFNGINELTDLILKEYKDNRISISLPSMRVDSFSLGLVDKISKVKKTGITLAPEAASERLLNIINKGYKPEDIIGIAEKAYKLGYRVIKLYFMIGLPGEEYSDLDDLINILYKISKIGFMQVNVSISTMIPKPFTPFQRLEMTDLEIIQKKQEYLRSRVKKHRIKLKFHNPYISILEAIFGRGDRRLGDVIEKAWGLGARFDQWEECFNYAIWQKALNDCGIKQENYLKGWQDNECLPWGHIDIGIDEEFLRKEMDKSHKVLNCGKN